jgi:hypothetical protein
VQRHTKFTGSRLVSSLCLSCRQAGLTQTSPWGESPQIQWFLWPKHNAPPLRRTAQCKPCYSTAGPRTGSEPRATMGSKPQERRNKRHDLYPPSHGL